jgi:hypothetical protein
VKLHFRAGETPGFGRIQFVCNDVDILKYSKDVDLNEFKVQIQLAWNQLREFRLAQISLSEDVEICLFHKAPNVIEFCKVDWKANSVGARILLESDAVQMAFVAALQQPLKPLKFTGAAPGEFNCRFGDSAFSLSATHDARLDIYQPGASALASLLVPGLVMQNGKRVSEHVFVFLLAATRGLDKKSSVTLAPTARHLCLELISKFPKFGSNVLINLILERTTPIQSIAPQPAKEDIRVPRRSPQLNAAARHVLQVQWKTPVDPSSSGLRPFAKGVVVFSARHAQFVSSKGKPGATISSEGITVYETGEILSRTKATVAFYDSKHLGARWIRNDWPQFAPRGFRFENTLVNMSKHLTINCVHTGAELFRAKVGATETGPLVRAKSFLAFGTQAGSVWGIDLNNKALSFCIEAQTPCLQLSLTAGNQLMCTFSQASSTSLASVNLLDLEALSLKKDVELDHPTQSVFHRGTQFIAGGRNAKALLLALNNRGDVIFETDIMCAAMGLNLFSSQKGPVVVDAFGACVGFDFKGNTRFRIGTNGHLLALAPVVVGHLLVIPGFQTRLIDLSTGNTTATLNLEAEPLAMAPKGTNELLVLTPKLLASYSLKAMKIVSSRA